MSDYDVLYRFYEADEVLIKAMETFWHYGYEATSIQTLVEKMGAY